MSQVLLIPPSCEPVTLAQVKDFCTIDFTDKDALLVGFMASAREACENWMYRRLITQTWRYYPGRKPHHEHGGLVFADFWMDCRHRHFELPFSPVVSVQDVVYIDINGATQTLVADQDYAVDTADEPARVFHLSASQWNVNRLLPNPLWIDFVCGYGIPAVAEQPATGYGTDPDGRWLNNPVPQVIQLAICMCVEQMYEERGVLPDLPPAVKSLLGPYRVMS